MRANRRFLFWGVFFVALGGIIVGADLNVIDESAIVSALRLWPLIIIAIGLAIVFRRTRYSLAAWLIAAALPGLALGGAVAAGPRLTLDCIDRDRPILTSQQGTFDGTASVALASGCGSLRVATEPGSTWRLEAGDAGNATARVASSATRLSIDAGTRGRWDAGTSQTWRLTLPTSAIDDLSLAVNAGKVDVDLDGARIGTLTVSANAAEASIDVSEASLAELSATLRLGAMSIRLPDSRDLAGSLEVDLGELKVCVTSELGLRVHRGAELGVIRYEGFEQRASVWQTPGYELAPHHADLSLDVYLGSIEFNPIGGCR